MNDASIQTLRTGVSLFLLLLLLGWESFSPYFGFFAGAGRERVRHGLRNLGLGAVNTVLNAAVCTGLWWAVLRWTEAHSFGLLHWLALPGWMRLVGTFLLMDLWMYLWHRLNHRIPLLWRFHRVHHSDSTMDVTTAGRFHLGEIAMSCVIRVPVIALAGVRLEELAIFEAAMFAVVQLQHANVTLTDPLDRRLRLLMVTPFMHKLHHSDWQPETDSNYSSLFSFWDRIFGSYRTPKNPHTLVFGLRESAVRGNQTLWGLISTPFRPTPRTDAATPGPSRESAG